MISKEVLAARAAWLQLIDGRTHIEIAEILEVSRLRVPKLVRWACVRSHLSLMRSS